MDAGLEPEQLLRGFLNGELMDSVCIHSAKLPTVGAEWQSMTKGEVPVEKLQEINLQMFWTTVEDLKRDGCLGLLHTPVYRE